MAESENGASTVGGLGRKSGKRDPYQKWLSDTYHALTRKVIESNNHGLNVNQITARFSEVLTPKFREALEDKAPKPGWKMPKGKPDRKAVGQHLIELCADPKTQVKRIGGGYYIVDSSSTQLNATVRAALQKKENMLECNITHARDIAGCYIITDPSNVAGVFLDLFDEQAKTFIDSGYWLENILAYMIRHNLFQSEAYSRENGLDRRAFRKSWERCFKNTQLLLFACAISPTDFLDYVMSKHGSRWTAQFLERKWDSIMKNVAETPPSELGVAALSYIRKNAFSTRRQNA